MSFVHRAISCPRLTTKVPGIDGADIHSPSGNWISNPPRVSWCSMVISPKSVWAVAPMESVESEVLCGR